MPHVACDPDRQRSVGASTELAIDPPIGLQSHKVLRRVEASPSPSAWPTDARTVPTPDDGRELMPRI